MSVPTDAVPRKASNPASVAMAALKSRLGCRSNIAPFHVAFTGRVREGQRQHIDDGGFIRGAGGPDGWCRHVLLRSERLPMAWARRRIVRRPRSA